MVRGSVGWLVGCFGGWFVHWQCTCGFLYVFDSPIALVYTYIYICVERVKMRIKNDYTYPYTCML